MKWYKMEFERPTWETGCQRGKIVHREYNYVCQAMRRDSPVVRQKICKSLPEAKTWCEREMRKQT